MSNTQIKNAKEEQKKDELDNNLFKSFQKIEDISEVEEILNGKGRKKVTKKDTSSNIEDNISNVENINTEINNIVEESISTENAEETVSIENSDNNSGDDIQSDDPATIISNHEAEIKKLEDQLLRTLAEMQNLRQRTEKDVSEARKYGVTNFARDMIGVYENLTRAEESVSEEDLEQNSLLKSVMEGVKLTQSELLKSFENQQIKSINPIGEKFNHNFHQAVVRIPDNNSEPNTVIQVMQHGYTIQDRLLRPAMVGVSVAAPAATPAADVAEDAESGNGD